MPRVTEVVLRSVAGPPCLCLGVTGPEVVLRSVAGPPCLCPSASLDQRACRIQWQVRPAVCLTVPEAVLRSVVGAGKRTGHVSRDVVTVSGACIPSWHCSMGRRL